MSNEPEYGKIKLQIVRDIADAIRFQRKSTRQYSPEDYARIIRAMLVLPSGEADSDTFTVRLLPHENAVGVLPTVYRGTANSSNRAVKFNSSTTSGTLV